jgi:hypothetical protein
MNRVICAAFVFCLIGTMGAGGATTTKLRVADAATDACFASCANTNASCKRVCPATFSTPCINSCDSQAQTCTQSCRNK